MGKWWFNLPKGWFDGIFDGIYDGIYIDDTLYASRRAFGSTLSKRIHGDVGYDRVILDLEIDNPFNGHAVGWGLESNAVNGYE